ERDLTRLEAEERKLAHPVGSAGEAALARLAEVQERVRRAESQLCRVREQTAALRRGRRRGQGLTPAPSGVAPVWGSLTPLEQARVVQLLVERVDYDGSKGKVTITFQPSGIQALADELAQRRAKEKTA